MGLGRDTALIATYREPAFWQFNKFGGRTVFFARSSGIFHDETGDSRDFDFPRDGCCRKSYVFSSVRITGNPLSGSFDRPIKAAINIAAIP
jgi:hypothetical protein